MEANVGAPGAAGDSTIWKKQPLCRQLSRIYDQQTLSRSSCWIPPDGFIVCDQAYCIREYQVQPFSDLLELTPRQRRFKTIQRMARRVVKRVFGIVKKQFR